MTNREDLDKLFEAALRQTEPPGYSTGAHAKVPAKLESIPYTPAPPFAAAPVTIEKPSVASPDLPVLDAQGAASLDQAMNAELEAIVDAKMAKAKAQRRRGAVATMLFFTLTLGGASAWMVTSPERMAALSEALSEIKSLGDVGGLVAKYQAALDKVAVRSQQIDAATEMMGVDPASVVSDQQGFDQEMRELAGEEGGPTTAQRDAKLREKFKSVQDTGSLTK